MVVRARRVKKKGDHSVIKIRPVVPRELLTTSGVAAFDPRSTSGHASATIADRTRYVLFTHPYEVVVYRRTLAAPADRRLRLDVPIGASFPGADRLVLLTRHGAARANGPWAQMAPLCP